MTEKIKLTREQADEIELIKNIDYAINIHPLNKRPDSPLASLSVAAIARALYVGYEVEPGYNSGDWVVVNYSDKTKVERILNVYSDSGVLEFDSDTPNVYITKDIRHATSSEISAEKERRSEVKLSEILHDLTIKEKQRLRQILNS